MSERPTLPDLGKKRPVEVLFIIDELCRMGGAERVLLNTVKLLPADRFSCSVASFRINPELDVLREFPCPLHAFPLGRTYDWNAFRVARKIRELIKVKQVAIVHTFFETSDLWGGFIAKLSGCPILVSSRRDMGIFRSRKHNVAYRLLHPQFDMILTVSEAVRTFTIRQDHLPPAKVRTLYNGLELEPEVTQDTTKGVRSALRVGATTLLVATVAHIRRIKGIDVLLRVAAAVRQEFPSVMFLIIGDISEVDYFRELQELAQKLGLMQNVQFLGKVADVRSLLRDCDVFFLPSRSEGFSNALIEALGCRLPCVATRVGGNAEALSEGISGYLVAADDVNAMTDRILRLLRDPALRLRLGKAARQTVEARFSMSAMMTRLINIYDELLAAKNV